MSTIASGEFWAFVGVVAGIYTLLGLGIQLEFGFAGLLNFGHVAFMAIGAYTMAILVVKAGWSASSGRPTWPASRGGRRPPKRPWRSSPSTRTTSCGTST